MSIKIIAEIGINHNGDMAVCKQLINLASECGCDAVKFIAKSCWTDSGKARGVQPSGLRKKDWNLTKLIIRK